MRLAILTVLTCVISSIATAENTKVFSHSVQTTEPEGGAKVTFTHSVRPVVPEKENKEKQSQTDYLKHCRWDDEGNFEYKAGDGKWYQPMHIKIAEKESSFLNSDGDRVEYDKGDVLVELQKRGWFKARNCTQPEIPDLDPHCLYDKNNLNIKNRKQVLKHNKECAIEWEVLRYTVINRLGILPSVMDTPQNKATIEAEMKKLWSPEFSFAVKQRAKYMVGSPSAHGEDPRYPQIPSWTQVALDFNAQFASQTKFRLNGNAENAWPNYSFDPKESVKDIAHGLAEADSGWNHHADGNGSHAANTVVACDIVGIGVYITADGSITAYSQFATKEGSTPLEPPGAKTLRVVWPQQY